MIPAIQIAVGAAESMEQRGQERLWLRVQFELGEVGFLKVFQVREVLRGKVVETHTWFDR